MTVKSQSYQPGVKCGRLAPVGCVINHSAGRTGQETWTWAFWTTFSASELSTP